LRFCGCLATSRANRHSACLQSGCHVRLMCPDAGRKLSPGAPQRAVILSGATRRLFFSGRSISDLPVGTRSRRISLRRHQPSMPQQTTIVPVNSASSRITPCAPHSLCIIACDGRANREGGQVAARP
jgi:hypothetical protein